MCGEINVKTFCFLKDNNIAFLGEQQQDTVCKTLCVEPVEPALADHNLV